jgi:hypothetical protein
MTEGGHHLVHFMATKGAAEVHHSTVGSILRSCVDHVFGHSAEKTSGAKVVAHGQTDTHIQCAGTQPPHNGFRTEVANLLTQRTQSDTRTAAGGGTLTNGAVDHQGRVIAAAATAPLVNFINFGVGDNAVQRTAAGGGVGDPQLLAQAKVPASGDQQLGRPVTAKPNDGQLTGGSPAPETAPRLDPKLKQSELVQAGLIKDATAQNPDQGYQALKPGETPKVSVVYENKDSHPNPPPPKPNYIVDKQGNITMVHNPEGNPPDGQVVIQVQRDTGDVAKPTAQQQAAIDDLVNYQGSRIAAQYGNQLPDVQTQNGPVKQVDINDPQGLVSDNVAHKFGDKLSPNDVKDPTQAPPAVPPDVSDTSDRMNRVGGSHGSTTVPRESAPGRQEGDTSTPAGIDNMISPREVPAPPSENKHVVALKDSMSALFHPDKTEPYSTVRERPGMGYQVGRYGLGHGFSMMGLAAMLGIDLGNPPDFSKLQEYLAQHPDALKQAMQQYADRLNKDADAKHLPADDKLRQAAKNMSDFATKLGDPQFQQGFTKFLSDLKGGGDPITKERVNQFMPKELQEALAEGGIKTMAKQLGINLDKMSAADAGKLALGAALGRTPTQEDLNNPQMQQYLSAGGNMYSLADARQQSLGDINVTDAQGKIVANAANMVGQSLWTRYMSNGNLGCAASVSTVLQRAGFSYANSASVQGLEQQLLAHGWHRDSRPQPGDVVCGYGGTSSGHTGIIGQNGMSYDNHSSTGRWSPDPVGRWASGWRDVHYLRPPGSENT